MLQLSSISVEEALHYGELGFVDGLSAGVSEALYQELLSLQEELDGLHYENTCLKVELEEIKSPDDDSESENSGLQKQTTGGRS